MRVRRAAKKKKIRILKRYRKGRKISGRKRGREQRREKGDLGGKFNEIISDYWKKVNFVE